MNRTEQRSIKENFNCWIRQKKDGTTEYYNKEIFNSDFTRKDESDIEEEKKQNIIDKIIDELNKDTLLYQQLLWGTKKFDFEGNEL